MYIENNLSSKNYLLGKTVVQKKKERNYLTIILFITLFEYFSIQKNSSICNLISYEVTVYFISSLNK